jgi:hypothetical protein
MKGSACHLSVWSNFFFFWFLWEIHDDYGAVGGVKIGRGNQSTRRKYAPVPLRPPQIPHDLGSNPGHRGGKPATNRLSYGTALWSNLLGLWILLTWLETRASWHNKHPAPWLCDVWFMTFKTTLRCEQTLVCVVKKNLVAQMGISGPSANVCFLLLRR